MVNDGSHFRSGTQLRRTSFIDQVRFYHHTPQEYRLRYTLAVFATCLL